MSANDTTAVEEEEHIDTQTFGDSTVRIGVDEATAELCREAHDLARDRAGDSIEAFDLFVLNHTEPSYHVEEVSGEEIAATAEYDPEADTAVSITLDLPAGVDREEALDSVNITVAGEE